MANNLSISKNTSNRDRIDIITSILDASNGGATRRRILLLSGLSSNQFKRYLSLLIENDYIRMEIQERSKGTAIYRTTDKRSEEHTSELQSRQYLVCRLLLEKK